MSPLPGTNTNADIGILKSLNTLCDKCLDHMLVKLEQNRIVYKYRLLMRGMVEFYRGCNNILPFPE